MQRKVPPAKAPTASSASMTIELKPLQPADRPAWEELARGYKAFYKTETSDAEYERAWSRLITEDGVHGLGAHREGRLVGITHYLYHTSTWTPTICYLQDLFTEPQSRGQGVARSLIEAVAREARARGATRLYWLTQEHNAVARVLYDRVAKYNGFVRYDVTL